MTAIDRVRRSRNGLPDPADSVTVEVCRDVDSSTVATVDLSTPGGYLTTFADATAQIYEFNFSLLNLDPAYSYTIRYTFVDDGNTDVHLSYITADTSGDSRASLRRRIGRLVLGRDKFAWGAVQAGGVNTITARFLRRYDDDALTGRNVYIVSGVGAGGESMISGNVQGSGQATVDPAWEIMPGAGAVAELWADNYSPDEVNDAINLAILDVSKIMGIRTSETITTFHADRRGFDLPDGFDWVYRIRYRQPGAYDWTEHTTLGPQNVFSLRSRAAYLGIDIPSDVTEVIVEGYRKPRLLNTDSDVSEVPSMYVVYMAAFQLEASGAEGRALDPEEHAGRAGNWIRQAIIQRSEIMTAWEPNTEPVN